MLSHDYPVGGRIHGKADADTPKTSCFMLYDAFHRPRHTRRLPKAVLGIARGVVRLKGLVWPKLDGRP